MVLCNFSPFQRPYHLPGKTRIFLRGTSRQRSALTETQNHLHMHRQHGTCATPTVANVHPGLQSTTALQSLSEGWRSSTERIAVETEQKTLTCASQTSFLLLPTRCSLGALSSATLLDLLLM